MLDGLGDENVRLLPGAVMPQKRDEGGLACASVFADPLSGACSSPL